MGKPNSQHHHLYNNRRWVARRAAQLRAHPLCAMCLAAGRVTAARVADHIEPHKGSAELFWTGGLQSLCYPCHNSGKKQLEKQGYSNQVDVHGRPIDPHHPSNSFK